MVRERALLRCLFELKLIILPRQARVEHRENLEKGVAFSAGHGARRAAVAKRQAGLHWQEERVQAVMQRCDDFNLRSYRCIAVISPDSPSRSIPYAPPIGIDLFRPTGGILTYDSCAPVSLILSTAGGCKIL